MAQENVTKMPVKDQQKTDAEKAAKPVEATSAGKPETAAKKDEPAVKKTVTKKKASPKKPAAKKAAVKKKTAAKKAAPKTVSKNKKTAKKPAAKKASTKTVNKGASVNLNTTPNKAMEKIMTQSKTQFDNLTKDATEMGRENIEACIQSSTIFAKGCEDMMRTMMSLAQNAAERQGKFVKEALNSKTLNEWTEVQNKIAQSNFDEFMSSATKMTELSVKVLNDAVEPINAQMTKGVQKATKSMAA